MTSLPIYVLTDFNKRKDAYVAFVMFSDHAVSELKIPCDGPEEVEDEIAQSLANKLKKGKFYYIQNYNINRTTFAVYTMLRATGN